MVKFFNRLVNVLLILVIIVLVSFLVLKTLNIINIFNVETGSMEDKIHSGDYVLLYKSNNYKLGDIVTFKIDDYYITHRIIKIDGDKVITKGDANNLSDDEIDIDQIEGKVIYYGALLNFIILYKYLIVVFLIGLYLLSSYFLSIEKDDKESNNDEELIDEIKEEI